MFGWFRLASTCASRWNPGEPIRISGEGVGQDLQGDIAAEVRVLRAIDLAHTPFTYEGGHVVMAEAGADFESHELSGSD